MFRAWFAGSWLAEEARRRQVDGYVREVQRDLWREGIYVPTRTVRDPELNAASGPDGITVNSGVPEEAVPFVYLHEVGHDLFGDALRSDGLIGQSASEFRADYVAGRLLVRTGNIGQGQLLAGLRAVLPGPTDFVHGSDVRRFVAACAGVRDELLAQGWTLAQIRPWLFGALLALRREGLL